jgi:hypothetical protein
LHESFVQEVCGYVARSGAKESKYNSPTPPERNLWWGFLFIDG